MLKVQPDIFKRFFFRKQADNTSDKFLPIIFITIIAVSTSIISLSTFELYDYKIRIDQFLSNEWNKIYDLYLGDTNRQDVEKYLETMQARQYLDFKIGFREYPKMISIKSKEGYIENVLAYAFSPDFETIITNLDFEQYQQDDVLFLDPALMNKLHIAENDLVLIKVANLGGRYTQALRVKPIENPTRIKCFFLGNYLDYASNCKIRFYYDNFPKMVDFLSQTLVKEYNFPTPLNFGYHDNLFGSLCSNTDIRSDFVLPLSYFKDHYGLEFKSQFELTFENGSLYNQNIDMDSALLLDYEKFLKLIEQKGSKLKSYQLFNNSPGQKFFVELDMLNTFNFQKMRRLETLLARQESIFQYYRSCDSLAIISINDAFKRENTYLYMHYSKLDSIELSKDILDTLNYKNVRWDTGKWNSIINLNESLKRGQKHIMVLVLVNLIIFLFFLSIKFLLRLKLEFHTIGVLKCFGYADGDIYKVYVLGYVLHVIIGLLLGLFPFSHIIGVMAGYDIAFINEALLNTILSPVNFITGYGLVLLLSTILAVSINLNRLVKRSNIYELIKYEG
ncbi:MAG: ABC transporter permease [Candidatus Marinimicrobia bacterium]|nr:ABC transporter permease [Candidatus Neomarinimicrobiota bacterium]